MLFGSAFQLAYVTTDIQKACDAMRDRYGVGQWLRHDTIPLPTDIGTMVLNLANAWVGSTWVEIIEPVDGAIALYRDWMEKDTVLRFHHVAVRLPDREACARVKAEAAASGQDIVFTMDHPVTQAFYVDTAADLGHYLEYLMFDGPSSTMAEMPQNIAGFETVY